MSNVYEESLKLHEANRGKLSVTSKVSVKNREDLSLAYSPGVAEPCRKIQEKKEEVYRYTSRGNMVAVVTDGTAVLGLGDIGPEAALPVMEGKAVLFKEFGGVDAFPICLDTKDTEEIIATVKRIAPGFGGINLEDISAPRCVEIETRLKEELDIPVFHDDQHGTAIVVVAGLINALKLVHKKVEEIKVVINGIGAAGSSIAKLILQLGVPGKNMLLVGIDGILNRNTSEDYNQLHKELAFRTNDACQTGNLKDALQEADVFIGVSVGGIVSPEMIKTMNQDAIVFAMANPTPEIMPEEAKKAGARIVGSGRSDYPNQINNVLVFPGLFKGALRAKSKKITEEMKMAAAVGLAKLISEEELKEDYIIPGAFDPRVAETVAKEVEKVAKEQGICRE
ncbi:malic enzyme, NAD-binding domain protein [Fusobacterium necrophorum subsp. funduliforme ATCC 51357]|uniref:Malate dehydrogenase n=1 Tax=Fusobacterium necrophorum subsp. funduliforme TaxID=143387 RepID=A0A162J1X2_9FUSO|nr:NADP-dependent malic enzyme [Fusobacterium necrophorum]AYV93831.1 NADP-dependent malic enzyme [Fusobacterium necrophorum subsp. funduliforme]EIJ72446.1 malic enzyme, NAD-binding domain protein [Fusobacterium necrophorum subsp. funduliforme ATCC 51357]KAB0552909.1 NADP-dependent malic enzyme [Fusobacterium necrophorum subsp. funduliforme]KYL04895.1 malate dehydrogenase [Fusobacterium necrophorum subsp. funduliforme]KYM45778.1 malate dehydrogenase [Fusobacterium necrophorum subsp. funduliform